MPFAAKKLDGALRIENKCSNDLINLARYATMNTREGGVNCSFGVLERGEMWLYSYAVQTLPFGATHPVRKMRTTVEQSALTRSQASLQPRFAWLSKVARRGVKSNVISKNFFRYCVGCEDLYGAWSFGFLRK